MTGLLSLCIAVSVLCGGITPLHEEGFTGEGVVIAIIDTGIDWMHPAFYGTFPTIEEMQRRNPEITNADGININGTYYFVGRDFVHSWPEQARWRNPSAGNPMETSPINFPESNPAAWTAHGTHVAGAIVGQGLGVAPGATAFHYRIFAGHLWDLDLILMAVEQIAYDRPDVVNMSLGGIQASSLDIITVAVNNIMLENPDITFVISAGNSGPDFMTNTAPAGSSMAITVAALEEPSFTQFYLNIGGFSTQIMPLVEHFTTAWHLLDNGKIIDLSPTFDHYNGEIRIFDAGEGTMAELNALAEKVGEDALRGAYIIARRRNHGTDAFYTVESLHMRALHRGIAGVIVINGYGGGDIPFHGANWGNVATGFMVSYDCGQAILAVLEGYDHFTISHSGELSPLRVVDFSSRGPTIASFDISPDLGAPGVDVFSAIPRWEVARLRRQPELWYYVPWEKAFSPQSGTSMAAPQVAGAVALLVNYSEYHGRRFTNYEIKTRLMNTAITLENYGVFDGARQLNVYAAAKAPTVIFVEYAMVTTLPGYRWAEQEFTSTQKGAFSFGLVAAGRYGRLAAIIRSTPGRVYNISHQQDFSSRNAREGAVLMHVEYVTINDYGYAVFDVEIRLPADAVELGFHMGYVIVEYDGVTAAQLPFATVAFDDGPVARDVFLYRPVITSHANMVAPESRQLHIFFTPLRGLRVRASIYRKFPGEEDFTRLFGIFHSRLRAVDIGYENLGEQHRGTVLFSPMWNDFSVPYGPPGTQFQVHLDFYAELNPVFDPDPTGGVPIVPIFIYRETVVLPFFFDTSPPEISNVTADICDDYVIITGHVFDEWMEWAIENNITFDIWAESPEISLERNLGVWVLIGENTPENRPIRAAVTSDGSFTTVFPNKEGPLNVTVWALDNYSVIPIIDNVVGASARTATNRMARTAVYFKPGGYVLADAQLVRDGLLHTGRLGYTGVLPDELADLVDYFAWIGTNITKYQVSI